MDQFPLEMQNYLFSLRQYFTHLESNSTIPQVGFIDRGGESNAQEEDRRSNIRQDATELPKIINVPLAVQAGATQLSLS